MAYGGSQYISWLVAGLGLKHLKLGLEEFVTKQIDNSHKELLNNVAKSMSLSSVSDVNCSGQTLISNVNRRTFKPPVFYCDTHITGDINTCVSEKCQNATCHKLINEINKFHRKKRPIWSNTNINPSQWICDHWEFAKCFLSVSGNLHIHSISEVDAAGILGIMINLLPIAKSLNIDDKDIKAESDVLSKCRHARNAIVHSHNYALDEYTMHKYLDLMKDVLKCIPGLPASKCVTDALSNIDQLKSGKLSMSEKEKNEIQAAAALAYRQSKINGWRNEQEYFVSTRASLETMKHLDESSFLVVTGTSGSGKSSIVHNAALNLQDQGYEIHIVDKPSQILKKHQQEKKTVFVLDDPFGKGTIDREKIKKWNETEDKLKHILRFKQQQNLFSKKPSEDLAKNENMSLGKTIILISCRLNIYKNHFVSQLAKSLKFKECDLSSDDMCLTLSEKRKMFAKYIDNVTFESVKWDMDYFPLVCMLSCRKEADVVKNIFENPPKHIREEIENMKHDDSLQLQFCCLCLCVMFDQGFNLNWIRMWNVDEHHQELSKKTTNRHSDDDYSDSYSDDDYSDTDSDIDDFFESKRLKVMDIDVIGPIQNNHKHVINIVCKAFKLDLNTLDCTKLLVTFRTITGTYCKEVGDVVVFKHDKILDIAAKICGETLFSIYISHASTKFIAKRYTLHDSPQIVTNEYLIHIPTSHEHQYFCRIFEDLTNKQTESFALNDQLENENFQNKLMQYVETHNKQEIIQTSLHKDSATIEESLADIKGGFKTFSEFLFKLGVNKDNVLACVCQSGNSEALEYLLTSCHGNVNVMLYEDINIDDRVFFDYTRTPLIEAVKHGDVHNVRLLLQFKADVNFCDFNAQTPLMTAAIYNRKHILEILLEHNASVTPCDRYDKTVLHHICSYDGTEDIEESVKLLLQYKPDVMLKDDEYATPVDWAKGRGHTNIVHILQQYVQGRCQSK